MKILHVVPHWRLKRHQPGTGPAAGRAAARTFRCLVAPTAGCATRGVPAGIQVDVLNWQRWLDPRPLLALARAFAELQPRCDSCLGPGVHCVRRCSGGAASQVGTLSSASRCVPGRGCRRPWIAGCCAAPIVVLACLEAEARALPRQAGTPVAKGTGRAAGVRSGPAAATVRPAPSHRLCRRAVTAQGFLRGDLGF